MTASLPQAHGAPVLSARIRVAPEDFRVDEIDGFEAEGSGEHLLLTVEKRGMNTAFAAKLIAQWAGIDEAGIGYAGLKDRHALTTQRFSVHLPRRIAPDTAALEAHEGLRVLGATWHSRKLPRGALAGNRFALRLRGAAGARDAVDARLQAIAARGVPNYFGEQRFGRDGDNVGNALAMFAGRRVARAQRTHLLSAARSQLFNRVLAARVEAGSWDAALEGEVWMLDGSRSVFGPLPFDDALAARLAAFDIHPTAPLWGRGELRRADGAAALELEALADAESRGGRAGPAGAHGAAE
ncbi:MAG: tRNA pseudouridine(13) synthase TruD [Luteimonas sp.]